MRRGSVSSWEPWARRNSANMGQITGSRSEFMTSDTGLSDIDCKKKGGCFLSYKKIAGVTVMFSFGVIAAALIGAYISPWAKNRSPTALPLIEEDEVRKIPSRFSVSTSIYPSLYKIELTPMEGETSMKLKGRVVIEFIYNGSHPLPNLVLNAKGILVSKARLLSFEEPVSGNVHSRIRREEELEIEDPDSRNSTETTTPADFETTISFGNETEIPGNSSIVEDSSSNDVGINATRFNDSKTDDVQVSNPTSRSPSYSVSPDNERGEVSATNPFHTPTPRSFENGETVSREIWKGNGETISVEELYVIRPGTEIPRGSYSLEITYEAKLDGGNTFANYYEIEGEKRWLLATRLKPRGARTLFPGFHERNSRARFSFSIARPKTLVTLFSMPLKSSDSISEERTMDHFETSPPLRPDSLAFAVSDLQPIDKIPTGHSNTAAPLTLWTTSNKIGKSHYITDCFSTVARLLKQYFSRRNPLPKLDVAALPRILDEGSGSSGLLFVGESLFDVTEDSSPVLRERTVMNVVKLIAEQWLGGLVSTKSFTDAWILEGSLIYLQHLLADKIDPTIGSINFIGGLQHAVKETDAYQEAKSLSSRTSPASLELPNLSESSRKGACLIRMMHSVLSDSGLRNGYEKLISRWENSEVDLSDFFSSMSNDAHWLPDGLSLSQVMTNWVNQPGFPLVTVTRNYETGSAIFRQERFVFGNSTPTKPQLWQIPITYVFDGENRWSSPSRIWLRQEQEVILNDVGRLDENKWLLLNVNQSGYYRVNYDEDNWKLLAVSLNSETLNKFPVETRISLVDDALTIAWGGRLKYETALNLINYLVEKEIHHSPWNVAFESMVKINNLLYNTPAYRSFQGFMAKFISPLFEKVTTSSDRSKLKLIAIKWACLVDNPACRTYLKSFSSVPEYLEDNYQCIVARFGGKSDWDTMILKISNPENSGTDRLRIFGALPCFQIEWILQSLLNGMLEEGKFEESETLALLRSFGENPMAARSAFKFMRGNWNKIFEKYSESYQISRAFILASMKGIADDQDLKDFQSFKEEHREKLRFMGHTIALAEAEARSRNIWLKKNFISIQKLFEEYESRTS